MKALSIKQPWAWLIVNGYKDIENRDWRRDNPDLKFRGECLIHTGLHDDKEAYGWLRENFEDLWAEIPVDLELGGIVGTCEIVDCVKEHSSPWFFGRYGFVIRNAKAQEFRPCVGSLGFFTPNFDLQYKPRPPKKEKKIKFVEEPTFPLLDGK